MKAGTTSLWSDLRRSGEIFVPPVKETTFLADTDPVSHSTLKQYLLGFAGADRYATRVDFCTDLAKRPLAEGAAERTVELLGPHLRLVYLTRDPIARLISHHRHEAGLGLADPDLATALDSSPSLISCSRYAYQLEPWRQQLPADQIFISSLEAYSENRPRFLGRLGEFLWADLQPLLAHPPEQRNAAASGPRGRLLRAVVTSNRYRRRVAPLIPDWPKEVLRRKVFERRKITPTSTWSDVHDDRRAEITAVFTQDRARLVNECDYQPEW